MRNGVLWRLASLLVCLTACVETAAAPPDPSCAVTRVVDGDTLHLTCGGTLHKVRLLGYDTPEIFHPHCAAEKQAGQHATDLMQALVASGPVTSVHFAGHDRYGRDLAKVQIGGQDVTTYMLATRLARTYQGHRHPDWCGMLAR